MVLKVFLTHTPDALAKYYGDDAFSALSQLSTVRTHEFTHVLDAKDLVEQAGDCEIIIADRQTAIGAEVFDSLKSLIATLRCAVDISTIDVAGADRAGVLVTRASAGFIASVAELAIGLMIDLGRGISKAVSSYRTGSEPGTSMGVQLAGSTVGIIGYGAIGRCLGTTCRAFGMTVLAADPFQRIAEPGVRQLDLDQLLEQADFVVCLAAATPQTKGLMNTRTFGSMKAGGYFINLARSSLVDEAALVHALESHRLAGAALDVGSAPDQKPPPALAAHPRIIATPHIGGLTREAVSRQAFDTVRQVAALTAGQIPSGSVNVGSATRLGRIGIATLQSAGPGDDSSY